MKWLLRIKLLPEGIRLRLRRHYMDWSDELEYQLLEENEASFHSRQLLNRARELRLPKPQVFVNDALSADYQRSGLDGNQYYLSLIGEQKVRSLIREEEKYQSERWTRRIPYITALTGLIGSITGLVALLTK